MLIVAPSPALRAASPPEGRGKNPTLRFTHAALALTLLTTACTQSSELETVKRKLAEFMPETKTDTLRPAAAPGLYELQRGFQYGYVTADGRYMIQGDLINLETGESITENARRGQRLAKLEELGADQMITFAPARPEDLKYTVTVFTDIDCGYCRKLHGEMAGYNQQGIAIRYLFYPRSGPKTESFMKAEAVWCSADRNAALTRAKLGEALPDAPACDNPILLDWQLGQDIGVRGTPMLVLPDGEAVSGYLPADALIARLTEKPGRGRRNAGT